MRWYVLFFFLTMAALGEGQDYDVSQLTTEEEHAAFFRKVRDARQEFPKRTGAVMLQYGYDSAEHRAHQDSMAQRFTELREVIEAYLDEHGFPHQEDKIRRLYREAQDELMRRLQKVGIADSLVRDSIIEEVSATYRVAAVDFAFLPVVMQVLETETDFTKRCETISLLRFEWEQGTIPLVRMLTYLRHTYQLRYGEELGIPTGTTERERLTMYARELSGCWGNW